MSFEVVYHVKDPKQPDLFKLKWWPVLKVHVRDTPVVPVRGHRAVWDGVLYTIDDVVHMIGQDEVWVFLERVAGDPPVPGT